MNKKRESIDVIHDILKFLANNKGSAKPTHILYKSNLSHQMLKDYLQHLISKGLIKEITEAEKRIYQLTPRGYSFLNEYTTIKKFMTSYGFE